MMNVPSKKDLMSALKAAGQAHHDYESNYLKGERDKHWAGWYASYTLGRLGDFMTPTMLTEILTNASDNGDWFQNATEEILTTIE